MDHAILTPDRYNILIEFAHIHLDFQRAELESVLSIHDIIIGRDCLEVSLPQNTGHKAVSADTKNLEEESSESADRPFLILSFQYDYVISKFNIYNDDGECIKDDISEVSTLDKNSKRTFASILSRCALIRSVIELWGSGTTTDSCANSVKTLSMNEHGIKLLSRHMVDTTSWKITVHTLGSKYNREEQNEMRAKFSFLNFPGTIQMKDPLHEYIIIREIELDFKGSPIYPRRGIHKEIIPEHDKLPPLAVYFGRILGGRRDWRGGRLEKYNLKSRTYLGPTSMDSELSLIMTNLGKVHKGSFCFDPFVGTGSILLTCGLRGGYCFGTDIDLRVLRGRSQNENVFCNFEQYKLERPELVRSDNALYDRHYRCHKPIYDAIICDPPYGIRAGARKSGSKLDQPRAVPEEHRHDHIAQTKTYAVSDVMADLLDVAARTLVMGGRLVYIIPSMTDFDVNTDLPRHECLNLLHICYQPLQTELGRRTVTMEKVKEYNPELKDKYIESVWINGTDAAEKCERIRERLLEVAKLKPDYEEKAAMRKKRRQETKEAKKKAKYANQAKSDST